MKIVVLGLGARGAMYAGKLAKRDGAEIVALCDKDPDKVAKYATQFGVSADGCFTDSDKLFAAGKLGDLILIATQDRGHFNHGMLAIKVGYDILIEKPLDPDINKCIKLEKTARAAGVRVMVCHVLRFAPYYRKIKEVIDSGVLGEIKEIRHSENVGYWHFAHSYVRGNWRNSDTSSPFLLAKCCHDMDLLYWFTGSKCKSLSSYGDLTYFTEKNAPHGAGENCFDCEHHNTCRFSAEYYYLGRKDEQGIRGKAKFPWGAEAFSLSDDEQSVYDALTTGARANEYSRCVWKCDNNVTDRQSVNMLMENGIICSFNTSAFNEDNYRRTEIHGTYGELSADDRGNSMLLRIYDQKDVTLEVDALAAQDGHLGGDGGIADAVLKIREVSKNYSGYTWLADTIESHRIVAAAELSRAEDGRMVNLNEIADIEKD